MRLKKIAFFFFRKAISLFHLASVVVPHVNRYTQLSRADFPVPWGSWRTWVREQPQLHMGRERSVNEDIAMVCSCQNLFEPAKRKIHIHAIKAKLALN